MNGSQCFSLCQSISHTFLLPALMLSDEVAEGESLSAAAAAAAEDAAEAGVAASSKLKRFSEPGFSSSMTQIKI